MLINDRELAPAYFLGNFINNGRISVLVSICEYRCTIVIGVAGLVNRHPKPWIGFRSAGASGCILKFIQKLVRRNKITPGNRRIFLVANCSLRLAGIIARSTPVE